jgi:thiosulfate dehydrogenase [quinone] large subunit
MSQYTIQQSSFAHFFLADRRIAWLWLIIRLYIGYEWLMAGWEKVTNPDGLWVGGKAGVALTGFLQAALKKTADFCQPAPAACHPDVQAWYAWFVNHVALPNVQIFSYMVAYGEVLVGVALILGFLVGVSTFFGMFMNLNFMLAGSVSLNPIMFTLGIGLILAWRVSGHIGLDRYVLPVVSRSLKR